MTNSVFRDSEKCCVSCRVAGGLAWRGVAWRGVAWRGVSCRGMACNVVGRGVWCQTFREVLCGVLVWFGMIWYGMVWCAGCDMVCYHTVQYGIALCGMMQYLLYLKWSYYIWYSKCFSNL